MFSNNVKYIGVKDLEIDLFEGQYVVPEGMTYNSYVILDDNVAVFDTVDKNFKDEWLKNLNEALAGRTPDYLIVQHMEPDHSANIKVFMDLYKDAKIVASVGAFNMMKNVFGTDFSDRKIVVKENDTLDLGSHKLTFIAAPLVHWPEVIFTYESTEKILFSADGFGKFGSTMDPNDDWACEARRYYFGIVGKFGANVQNVLKKAANLEINTICPLHGPILDENLGYYLNTYNTWSSYQPEDEGVTICYASVYGSTKEAAEYLCEKINSLGTKATIFDLARDDQAEAIEDAFRYSKIVLASVTYNGGVFPFMNEFIHHLLDHNYQNRTMAFIENGMWAPQAMKQMKALVEPLKNMTYAENNVTLKGAFNDLAKANLDKLAEELK